MDAPRQRKILLAVAFLLAIGAAFVFGYRAGRHARRMRWASEPVRPWMSIPFIAHVHHIPPEVLYKAVGLQPRRHDRRPLRQIARDERRPLPELMRGVEKAVAAAHPPGAPAPSPPSGRGP